MQRNYGWLVVLCLSVAARPMAAQDAGPAPSRAAGIGIFLNPAAILTTGTGLQDVIVPVGLGNFTVPVWVTPRVRLEPEIGWTRVGSDTRSPDGTFSQEFSASLLRFGAGVHVAVLSEGALRSAVGLRFGLSHFGQTASSVTPFGSNETKLSRNDSYVGVALGGEYFLARRFSLGGELQITRVSLGNEEVEGVPSPAVASSASLWSTNGLVSVRFYLF